jgi:hypothetical protein
MDGMAPDINKNNTENQIFARQQVKQKTKKNSRKRNPK